MNKYPYKAPMSLLTTLLVFLVVCSASVENRAASPASPVVSVRKPPFNGSIFGKRSVLPPVQGMQDGGYSYIPVLSSNDNSGNFVFDLTDRGQFGMLLQQQEALIRLVIGQCLIQQLQRQDNPERDSIMGALCANLAGDSRGSPRRSSLAGDSWFDQLASM